MASPTLSQHKPFAHILVCCTIIIFCHYSGNAAEDNPAQMVQNALFCFNNKFIYAGCQEAYRLDQSGNINIPPPAIDLFCNGPCLTETQLVLNCVDNIVSNFLFDNKASVRDIRGAINVGCTYNNRQQGLFNFRGFQQGQFYTSDAGRLRSSGIVVYVMLLIIGFCHFIVLY